MARRPMKTGIPEFAIGPLRVAAQAGFLTKRIWLEYFSTGNRVWRCRRWKALLELGLFDPVPDYGFVGSVLCLSPRGRNEALRLGMDPVFQPRAKNLWHDEELIRLALFLERQGWIKSWRTEQALKSSAAAEPLLGPGVPARKYPDLLIEWKTPRKPVFWAVELERTRKVLSRYYEMVGAYKGLSAIDTVLIIVAAPSIESNIQKAQARMGYPDHSRPMVFANLSEIAARPADCELRHKTRRITLGRFARALTGITTTPPQADALRNGNPPGYKAGNTVSGDSAEVDGPKPVANAQDREESHRLRPP